MGTIETDFVIVGQGLAGTTLARELDAAGARFLVVDDAAPTAASRAAAGMMLRQAFISLWS